MEFKTHDWNDINEEYILNLRNSGESKTADLLEKLMNDPENPEKLKKNLLWTPNV